MILQGDCLDLMKDLEPGSIDLICTDLPYGTTRNKWDSIIPLDLLWPAVKRVLKKDGIFISTASTPFDKVLGASNLQDLKYEYIWVKNNVTGHLNAKKMPMKQHENILIFGGPIYNPQGLLPFNKITRRGHNGSNFGVSGKSNFQEFTNYPKSVLYFDYDKDKLHSTQKPVALFEYLIKTYSNQGDLVLDIAAGSGTTAVAALNTDRRFILMEKDPVIYQVALTRLNQHKELIKNGS